MNYVEKLLGFLLPVLAGQLLLTPSMADGWAGARSQGIGGCYVTVSDGAEGVFANPAFLAELELSEFLVGYGRLCASDDRSDFRGAVARAFQFGGLGLGYERSSSNCWEDVLTVGYGRFLPYYIASLGLNMKFLSYPSSENRAAECSGLNRALGLDLGLLFRFLSLSLGYVRQNLLILEFGDAAGAGDDLEAHKAFGLSYRYPESLCWSIQASSLSHIRDELRLGAEMRLGRSLRGRVGLDRGMPALGLGLNRDSWTVDMATLFDDESGNTYSASFEWRVGRRFLFE